MGYPLSQQVEAEFSPRPNIKKLNPAKVSTSGPSMVPVQLKTGQKSGCSPDFLGARALNPHRSKGAKNAYKNGHFCLCNVVQSDQ